jgi:hypothetical protein
MNCHRCHGFMCPVDLLLGESRSEQGNGCGWRCVACGEIIDQVIVQNRIRTKAQRFVRRLRKPRQPIRTVPARDVGIHRKFGPMLEGGCYG